MKKLFFEGGAEFMGALSVLLIVTTAWIIYHFIIAYRSNQTNKDIFLRKLGYGKLMGLFTLMIGVFGNILGFMSMFHIIEKFTARGENITPQMIYGGIKVSMIVTIYGILIYLFSILLWYVASILINKKLEKQHSI